MEENNHVKQLKSVELREHYCEMLQNAVLFSPVYGRAEIYKGLPFYCDGKNLFVVGYSLGKSQTELAQCIGQVISQVSGRLRGSLQTIQFWGPVCPHDRVIPRGFVRTAERRPDKSNCDVILVLDETSLRRINTGRDITRAIRNGLTATINHSKQIDASHSAIIKSFLKTHPNLENDDVKYVTHWRQVLSDDGSVLFEVRQLGQLTGFAILNCFGTQTATYAYGFFNNAIAGTSDLAHKAMIEYCHEMKFRMLDLGYSVHSNLLRYKMKWGNTELVDPPWSVYWQWRGSLNKKQTLN